MKKKSTLANLIEGPVYFAAGFHRKDEIKDYADEFVCTTEIGVCSSWIHTKEKEEKVTEHRKSVIALQEIKEVKEANTIICFTEARDEHTTAGHHIEYGIAVGANKKLIVVGERSTVFYFLPQVHQFNDWPEFMETIKAMMK